MGCENRVANTFLDSDESTEGEIICGPRQRRAVDYKKLYDVSITKFSRLRLLLPLIKLPRIDIILRKINEPEVEAILPYPP
jgi:hypothetical protein